MNTQEGNEIIARYDGCIIDTEYRKKEGGICDTSMVLNISVHGELPKSKMLWLSMLKYNSDWNWLIPVVKKVLEELKELKMNRDNLYQKLINLEIKPLWTMVVETIQVINKYKEDENNN